MGRLYALIAFLALQGCGITHLMVAPEKPEPPDLKCSASCYADDDPLPKWGDGDRDYEDTIVYVDGLLFGQCAAKHDACRRCLIDARKAGAIK